MVKASIITNMSKDNDLQMTKKILEWLNQKGCEVLLPEEVAFKINRIELGCKNEELYGKCDFAIVLGGDGTLLGVARECVKYNTPILGVNIGHLGFIAEVEAEDVFDALEKILNNEYSIEERLMLEAKVVKDGLEEDTFYCLNDFGITKGILARIITLKVFVNNEYMDTYNADGIIISTPTGSTAYSLSAGGPILNPKIEAIIITPICCHSLSARSIVISKDEIVRVEVADDSQCVYLTTDGQKGYKLKNGDSVIIKKAPYTTKLIKVLDRSFYDVLRNKLKNERE
ncbi:NAD(+)/NADH kinase [Caloramator sp. E03]|uniref:NAD(+)/NADH kinase n=1 Tax=Caloramator sp. E03 TaxID=2576307 RepID=UPI00110FF9BB|nr:NAD(+)/NADH kinase [Caloramator sp. E03]QCX32687.1 NAD(+)/NADH kinase [Caloramator sp. E03]